MTRHLIYYLQIEILLSTQVLDLIDRWQENPSAAILPTLIISIAGTFRIFQIMII